MKKAATHTDRSAVETTTKPKTKRPRRRTPAAPELPEKLKKLTLKAFRLTYEAHNGKRS